MANLRTITVNSVTYDVADAWTSEEEVTDGYVMFNYLEDTKGWGYEPYFNITSNSVNKNPSATIQTINYSGTHNMSILYETDADDGTYVKLRIIK